MSSTSQQFEFQTEARRLLDLMIHSVYSNREIFLRELISNSSDALDKLRIESLRNPAIAMPAEPAIRVAADGEKRTLEVSDNGIGMSHDELIANLGTIARSGTREFIDAAGDRGATSDLIGQFGVGFYASFMVADRVVVVTRRAGETTAWRWESEGAGTYSVEPAERSESGTTVTLHLKPSGGDDAPEDFTQEWTLRQVIRRYSDFVTWPIELRSLVTAPEGEEVEGAVIDGEGKRVRWETVNSMKAIWRRPAAEVTAEEHNEFYRHISHDWHDPLTHVTVRAEGTQEYYALLYIPSKAPLDMMMRERERGLHLYVRRVFIMEEAKELLPLWLRFVVGVVDSEDLPLNISREILQQNAQVRMIRRRLVAKVLERLREMCDGERERYLGFWKEFGRVVKEGIYMEPEHADAILDIALFASTRGEEPTTLGDYLGRMQVGQEKIYYIAGDDRSVLENSPHLEAFRTAGYEVLILTDPVDEVWLSARPSFQGKELQSVARGSAPSVAAEGSEEERKERAQELAPLMEALRQALESEVKEVRLSNRLTTSAVCLVADEQDMSPQLERMLRAMGQEVPHAKRILELNPGHPLMEKLERMRESGKGERFGEYAQLLYGQALLAEGEQPSDPAAFSRLVASLMVEAGE